MLLPFALVIALLAAVPAMSGGLACATPHDEGCYGTSGGAAAAPIDLPQGDGLAARRYYDQRLLHLWRDALNGTCLGALGAWHLTPYRIIAEGIEYEIVSVAGTPARIGIGARRVYDRAPTTILLTPRGRDRLDVTGEVIGVPRHFNTALYRCPDRDDWWWDRPRS